MLNLILPLGIPQQKVSKDDTFRQWYFFNIREDVARVQKKGGRKIGNIRTLEKTRVTALENLGRERTLFHRGEMSSLAVTGVTREKRYLTCHQRVSGCLSPLVSEVSKYPVACCIPGVRILREIALQI